MALSIDGVRNHLQQKTKTFESTQTKDEAAHFIIPMPDLYIILHIDNRHHCFTASVPLTQVSEQYEAAMLIEAMQINGRLKYGRLQVSSNPKRLELQITWPTHRTEPFTQWHLVDELIYVAVAEARELAPEFRLMARIGPVEWHLHYIGQSHVDTDDQEPNGEENDNEDLSDL